MSDTPRRVTRRGTSVASPTTKARAPKDAEPTSRRARKRAEREERTAAKRNARGPRRAPKFVQGYAKWLQVGGQSKPATYRVLLGIVTVLSLIGLVFVLSASSVASVNAYGSAWVVFARQLGWMVLAIVGFVVASRVDYRKLQRFGVPLLVVSIILLAVVLIPGVGIYVAGSRRWLGFGALRFQPSEIAKLALLVFSADLLTRRERDAHHWKKVLLPVMGAFVALAVLVMKEPDMDSTVVLALIAGSVLLVGGIRMRDVSIMLGSGVLISAIAAVAAPYRRARVFSFLHPFDQAAGNGYQLGQSLIALGSGGLFGRGLGASRQKWLFLPNAHTDFILAIIGEEAGLLGTLLVIALFAALAVVGVIIAKRAPDRFGMLVASGITAWIAGQAVINIGAVIGVLPVSGIPLPFVSFGGSALIFTMFAAGILGNIARQGIRTATAAQPASRPARVRSVRVAAGAAR